MKNGKKPTLAQKKFLQGERAGTGELADREGYAGGAGGSQPGRAP